MRKRSRFQLELLEAIVDYHMFPLCLRPTVSQMQAAGLASMAGRKGRGNEARAEDMDTGHLLLLEP